MSFEQALKRATEMGGDAKTFDQGRLNFCTGFAARWIKYQLLDKADDFWSTTGAGAAFTLANDRYSVSEQGRNKIGKIHQEKARQSVDEGFAKAGLATGRYLSTALQPSLGISEHDEPFEFKPLDTSLDDLVKEIETMRPGSALHISLQPHRLDDAFHSVAAFRSAGKITYFDPCMGQVRLAEDLFREWWINYRGWWAGDESYSHFTRCVTTNYWRPSQLAAKISEARSHLAAISAISDDQALELDDILNALHGIDLLELRPDDVPSAPPSGQ